jgi:P4 family phage/plasmid primase-like protien
LVELRACPNSRDGADKPASIFTRDMEDVDEFVRRWDRPGFGVYYGALTRNKRRGTIENAFEMPSVWVDNDQTPKDELRATLLASFCPPSVIIDSGRGLHAYWLLNEAEDVSAAQTNDHPMVDLLRSLRRIYAGDPAVCDLARIMRLPGSHNTKYGEPRPVTVIHQSDARYSLADLVEWMSWQEPLVGEPGNPFLAAADSLGIRPAAALTDMAPGNIHETQLRVSAAMVAAGKAEDEIVAELIDATKAVAPANWNWKQEEAGIREMVRGAVKKYSVVNIADARKKKTSNGGDAAGTRAADDKEAILIRVARVAMEAWDAPLITVGGELWTYDAGCWRMFDPELEHRLRVHIQGAVEALRVAPNNSTLNGAYRYIYERPELVRADVLWDRAGVIVGRNGALNMETGRVEPHHEVHYATRRVACAIDPAAECPVWREFLRQSLPDGAAETLQEWFGAALVRGKVRELSKGLIIYGPSRTGKTQITEVTRALLGGATCGLRVRAMSERFGMQPLIGAAGWIADDAVGQREEMDAEAWKVVVTGESVSVERKNKTSLEVAFDLPVLLTMNNFPIVKDDSDAVYNRALVLPMDRQWAEEEAQPIARTVVASELSGVLNWALEGWDRLKARGRYTPPPCMIAAGKEFKGQNNPMEEFLSLCVEKAPDMFVMRDDFLRIFNHWLKREIQVRNPWSGKAVGLAIANNNLMKIPGDLIKKGRVWIGIRFTEPALAFEEKDFSQPDPSLDTLNFGMTPQLYERYHKVDLKRTRF